MPGSQGKSWGNSIGTRALDVQEREAKLTRGDLAAGLATLREPLMQRLPGLGCILQTRIWSQICLGL